jgi:hypothetical protein
MLGATLGCAVAVLAGCGMGPVATSSTGTMVIRGVVHGGQNPVTGSSIQLYTVGTSGNGSTATPMLRTAVSSGNGGDFSINFDYECGQSNFDTAIPSDGDHVYEVYIVATGGNPGLAAGTQNDKLVLMAALGNCSKLSSTEYIEINEVTTAAAAWALAPFMTSATHVGATAGNALGIENAFLDAGLIADTSTGLAAVLPSNLSLETDKLYAFADAIASCVNSDGTSGCEKLFTAATSSGVSRPEDTLTAALDIVSHPGTNVAGVFGAIGSSPPFPTAYTTAPNDWTMSLTVTGGGLSMPTALGIDSRGNVWVGNQDGPLSAFDAQGTPLSASGFGGGSGATISQVDGLAVDTSDNIWVANYNATYNLPGALTEFLGVQSGSPGSVVMSNGHAGFTASSCYPTGVAADTNGDIFVANEECSSANLYDGSGGVLYADVGEDLGLGAKPLFLAVDAEHGFWLSDNDGTVTHISAPSAEYPFGQLLSHPECCTNSHGLATDASGNVWVADYLGSAFSEILPDGTVQIKQATGGGVVYPYAVAVDGGQNVWLTNLNNRSISEIAGTAGTLAAGTAISPSTGGVYGIGGYGFDAGLEDPYSLAPDRSGNLWVSNQGNSTVVMFFGLAAPTVTPLQPVPSAP